MGKALIIKGADFSTNAIEGINIDGKRYLTMENALGEYPKAISKQNNTVSFSTNSGKKYKIFKIQADEILEIPRQTGYYQLFFTEEYNITENINKNPAFTNCVGLTTDATSLTNEDKSTHSLSIKGDKDYFVYVLYDGTVGIGTYQKDVSFPTLLVAKQEYIPNRTFTEDNYDSSLYSSYPNNAQWGNATSPTDEKPTVMNFNVHKGETVHIKANANKATVYRIIPQSCPINNLPSFVELTAGEETDIPITDIGLAISIYRGEGSVTDKFPAELYTTLTPISE